MEELPRFYKLSIEKEKAALTEKHNSLYTQQREIAIQTSTRLNNSIHFTKTSPNSSKMLTTVVNMNYKSTTCLFTKQQTQTV